MSDPQYPEGQMSPDDEGATTLGLGIVDGNVVIQFTKPITWIAGDAEWADQLAEALMEKAAEVREKVTKH